MAEGMNDDNTLLITILTFGGMIVSALAAWFLTKPPEAHAETTFKSESVDIGVIKKAGEPLTKTSGAIYPSQLTIVGGSQYVYIDFVESRHRNIPPGSQIVVPNSTVQGITIRNDGVGDIMFQLNQGGGGQSARTTLKQNETFELPQSHITSLTVVAPTVDATVRIIATV